MKVNRVSTVTIEFTNDEILDALVFWLSRGEKNNTDTIEIASMMNLSKCSFSYTKDAGIDVTFNWKEVDDESW